MKKRNGFIFGLAALTITMVCAGCGSQTQEPGSSQLDALTPELSVLLGTDGKGGENLPELSGNETFSSYELAAAAKVFSRPDSGASVLGSISAGSSVQAYGPVQSGGWYMVSYNGRVAYITSDTVKTEDGSNTPAAYSPADSITYYWPENNWNTEPVTEAPTSTPETEAPTTEAPTTPEEPTSEEQPTEEPTSEEPPTEEPTSEEPTSEEPPTEEPPTEEPPTEEPPTEEQPSEESVDNPGDDSGF